MVISVDVAVVGAGIAGVSVAAEMAMRGARVAVLDAEAFAPVHTTARSAALADPCYVPSPEVAALTVAGSEALKRVDGALVPKQVIHLFARKDLGRMIDIYARSRNAGAEVELLDPGAIAKAFPYVKLSPDYCDGAILVPAGVAHGIDVNKVYQRASIMARTGGGEIFLQEGLETAKRCGRGWTIKTRTLEFRAEVLVNAAGAWVDEVALSSGVAPCGVRPLRRSVVVTGLSDEGVVPGDDGAFIFWDREPEDLYCEIKPGGRVLISPADETPSFPHDAYTEGNDIPAAIERFHERTAMRVSNFSRDKKEWAGLRTFVADRKPAIGWDPDVEGFFWSAAYGGFGIECSIAAAQLGASMILRHLGKGGEVLHADLAEAFAPARLRRRPAELAG